MANNVSITIQATTDPVKLGYSRFAMGDGENQYIPIDRSAPNHGGTQYWIVIIERTTLKIEASFAFNDNSAIPPQLKPYQGNSQYFMIFSTYQMYMGQFPTGDLYNFLISEGAGVQLKRAEQIYANLNCSSITQAAYTLVAVLGDDGGAAFEGLKLAIDGPGLVTTLQLIPIDIGGKPLYTPGALT